MTEGRPRYKRRLKHSSNRLSLYLSDKILEQTKFNKDKNTEKRALVVQCRVTGISKTRRNLNDTDKLIFC